MKELEEAIDSKKSSKSAAYIARMYEQWCEVNEVKGFPVTYESIAGFLANRVLTLEGSTKSIEAVKAAIKDKAISRGFQWLEERESRKLRRLVARMKYDDINPIRRVKPIQIEHLRKWFPESGLEEAKELQTALMLYLGHDGLLRIGELLSGIRAGDIRWRVDRRGFDLWLERSKANQSGDGELITIVDYDGQCAVKLMRKWFRNMDLWKLTDRMLFPSRRGKGTILWDKTIS